MEKETKASICMSTTDWREAVLCQKIESMLLASADADWKTRIIRGAGGSDLAQTNGHVSPVVEARSYRSLALQPNNFLDEETLLDLVPHVMGQLGVPGFMVVDSGVVRVRVLQDDFDRVLTPQREAFKQGARYYGA